MNYLVKICVTDPDSYTVSKYQFTSSYKRINYQDIIAEFFGSWDRKDKYERCYAIGVESINLV